MTETVWADVSYYNPAVNDRYPYRGFAFRSNDGTFRDPHFWQNLAWAKHACDTGKLDFFIVYVVFESNWRQTVDTFAAMVGKPHPRMAVMIDVETWNGTYSGDHSGQINSMRLALVRWLRSNMPLHRRLIHPWRRVVGYGNVYDLTELWPNRPPRLRLVIADYDGTATFPGIFAQQFSSAYDVPPFGPCDANRASRLGPGQVAKLLGVTGKPGRPPKHRKGRHRERRHRTYVVRPGDTLAGIAAAHNLTLAEIERLNPKLKNPDLIRPGQRINVS